MMKKDGGSVVVVDLLLYVSPVVCGGFVLSLFWYALLCVLYSFAIILTRKRERERAGCLALIVFLCLATVNALCSSSWCLWLVFSVILASRL